MPDNKTKMKMDFSIDHVGISVGNLERTIDFYSKIFGFKCEKIIDLPVRKMRVALLQRQGFTIEALETAGALPLPEDRRIPETDLKTIGVKHFAIRVKDIAIAADYLRKNSVEFLSEPTVGVRGLKRFFVKDPDGIAIEISEGPARK